MTDIIEYGKRLMTTNQVVDAVIEDLKEDMTSDDDGIMTLPTERVDALISMLDSLRIALNDMFEMYSIARDINNRLP